MFQAILAKIRAFAPLVTLTLAAILFTLAAPAYADGHHDPDGPFWFNEDGWTRLHYLAALIKSGDPVANLARAQNLLSRGANPNVVSNYGYVPLMAAAQSNYIKMASLLIANGAFVYMRNIRGETAMDLAIKEGHTQMQALLHVHGGKCNQFCQ